MSDVWEKWRSAYTGYVLTVWVKKIPPADLWQFFQNGRKFFNQIVRAYYAFLSMLDYEFLFNYLQLWRSYAILSATTQRALRSMVDILSTAHYGGRA